VAETARVIDHGPPVPAAPPLVERRYRHPGTGEEAALSVRLVHPPGGPFLEVRVSRPDQEEIVPGIMYATWAKTREQAREAWAERAQELKAAGYERTRVPPAAAEVTARPRWPVRCGGPWRR
jgi:hypothetical protein